MDDDKKRAFFGFGKKKETLTLSEKEKAEGIVQSLSNSLEDDYSITRVEEAEKKAEKYRDKKQLAPLWSKIQVLFLIARHPTVWGPGVAVPACAAILYLVLPLDAVPDISQHYRLQPC